MQRYVSIRELRNSSAEVTAALQRGERLTLTVRGTPLADIVPHHGVSPWKPAWALRSVLEDPREVETLRAQIDAMLEQSNEEFFGARNR